VGLSGYEVRASIAVSDIARARELYEGKLGLSPAEVQPEGSRVHPCGGGTSLHLYASPARAGSATATQATWYASDLEQLVDELRSTGVTFERYEERSLKTDEKGIHELGGGGVVLFKHPDGNTFAIEQKEKP